MQTLVRALRERLTDDEILASPESCDFYSHDIFTRGIRAGVVVRPSSVDNLARAVGMATQAGLPIIPRGGGMSYTKGYVPSQKNSVIFDLQNLNKITEINATDMYVTVEAGVTWKALAEALKGTGLRTPFRGPFSGSRATIGGGASQQTIFWGAGQYGCSADSIISLDVVLADGSVLSTGTASQKNAAPFYRHFGPDLTGIFLNDTGALGIKARVTMRLMPEMEAHRFLSFDFETAQNQMDALCEITRRELASEIFGIDPVMSNLREHRDSVINDAKRLGQVVKNAGLSAAANLIRQGRKSVLGLHYPLHIIAEDRTEAGADFRAEAMSKIAKKHGGRKIENAIPTVIHASPFAPLNNIVGPNGERWVPVNALLPLSKAMECQEGINRIRGARQDELDFYKIQTGMMVGAVSTNCIFLEPTFYWPDRLYPLHKAVIENSVQKSFTDFPNAPEAFKVIYELRTELSDYFSDMGTSHLQLGKTYHYAPALRPEAYQLMTQIKQAVDPKGLMNPGSLGL